MKRRANARTSGTPRAGLSDLLKPYAPLILILAALTILGNGLNLLVPRIISRAIDGYAQQRLVLTSVIREFSLVALGVFVLAYLQTVVQTYASERVAKDVRTRS